jgi:hypothetical protein
MLHPSLFIVQGVRSIGKDGVRVRFFLEAFRAPEQQPRQLQLQLQLQQPLAEGFAGWRGAGGFTGHAASTSL